MKSFNKFIEEMASSAFASSEEQPQPTALQRQKINLLQRKQQLLIKSVNLKTRQKDLVAKNLAKSRQGLLNNQERENNAISY